MALYKTYLLFLVFFCLQTTRVAANQPPNVILDRGLAEIDAFARIIGNNFTSDAVTQMTAEVVGGSSPGCPSNQPIAVAGNMDCLISFWRFRLTTTTSFTYQNFLDTQRDECSYSIGFDGCLTGYTQPNQTVTSDANAAVDANLDTVWAHPINAGYDVQLKINLHGCYEVTGLALDVETVPLQFSVSLVFRNEPPKHVLTLQQGECDAQSTPICQQYRSMSRKILTVAWRPDLFDLKADHVIITLHGVQTSAQYTTNYNIIRNIKFLAKALTRPAPTRAPKKRKRLRHILEAERWRFVRPISVTW